jgi:hypothetical protein
MKNQRNKRPKLIRTSWKAKMKLLLAEMKQIQLSQFPHKHHQQRKEENRQKHLLPSPKKSKKRRMISNTSSISIDQC